MKIFNINIKVVIWLVVTTLVGFSFFGSTVTLAATTPSLGTAATYGILTYNYDRNGNPPPILTGNFGYTTISGSSNPPAVSGTTNIGDGAYNQAGVDQATALADLNNQPCTFTFPAGNVDLATDTSHGALGVYTPGVYCTGSYPSNATIGAAGITLSGNGTYIFRIHGLLSTAAHSVVSLENGASACDVFWTPDQGPVLPSFGYASTFVGTDIDPGAVTINDNVTWNGRILAYNGIVKPASNFVISVPSSCTPPPPPPPPARATLRVIKHVINDDGSKEIASDFILHVKGSGGMGSSEVVGSPASGVESPGTSYSLTAGTYIVSEDIHSGYTPSFSGDCDAHGNITLASGSNAICIITNNDIAIPPPPPPPPSPSATTTLHIIKIVTNDNGGKAKVSEAVVHVVNGVGDVSDSPSAGTSSPGKAYILKAGSYTVSEDFFSGYSVKIGGDCSDSGTVELAEGDNKTCTITNNDIAVVVDPPVIVVTTSTPPVVIPETCNICQLLTYDIYIINPDGSERHTGTPWVKVTDRSNGVKRYSFEDATLDPNNILFDHNDSVVDIDFKDCQSVEFMFVSSDASWKHQVRIKVSIGGVAQSDTLVVNDSKAVVGTSKTVNATSGVNSQVACSKVLSTPPALKGKILLQVQAHGEAWYINPKNGLRYYMANGNKAYEAMRNFGVGINDKDLVKIKASKTLAKKSSGKIFLQVQSHGEAYYIDFNGVAHYLKDGAAAYEIMRSLGLGITDINLSKITIGSN